MGTEVPYHFRTTFSVPVPYKTTVFLAVWRENGWKWRKLMEMDKNGMEMDGNGRKWMEMEGNGRKWTEIDGNY